MRITTHRHEITRLRTSGVLPTLTQDVYRETLALTCTDKHQNLVPLKFNNIQSTIRTKSELHAHPREEAKCKHLPQELQYNNTKPFCTVSTSFHLINLCNFTIQWSDVEWTDVIYVKWFCFEVKWSEVKWVTMKFLWTKAPCTLRWPYTEGTLLYCDYFIWVYLVLWLS